MRTLKLHFPDDALPTLDTCVKQTREARVFRRAQAVREVVKGQRLQTVSDALSFTCSALRKWVYRFASHGTQPNWLEDRTLGWFYPLFAPKPRPPQVTGILGQEVGPSSRQDAGGAPSVRSQAARRDAGGTARANEALRYSLSAKLALDYQALPGR